MNFNSLDEVYFDAARATGRYADVARRWADAFPGTEPDSVLRSPGRVNIIGEHIDYSMFSVLPAAIEFDMILAYRVTDEPSLKVVNVNKEQFADSHFPIDAQTGEVAIDASHMEWANYFKCGFVVAERFLKQQNPAIKPKGMQVVMSGNVPVGGGLSSSAAFVVTATLAVLRANGFTDVSKELLQKLSTTCEQLVGVNSGGMDQAASIYGSKDHALFVSFRPTFSVEQIAFPKNLREPLVLIIANSMVTANKYETGPIHYNLRVVEVTLAANIIAKKLGLTIPQDGNLQAGTLRGVYDAVTGSSDVTKEGLEKLLKVVDECLQRDGYTRAEAAAALGISEEELERKYMTTFPVRFEKLKLWQRAHHVYDESLRVLEFADLMQNPRAEDPTKRLGELLNEAHASAQNVYENSAPLVDELCQIARDAGSAGSRVTGAGWGGCTVHLVPESRKDAVKQALLTKYYAKHFPQAPADALVESRPGSGTAIFPGSILASLR